MAACGGGAGTDFVNSASTSAEPSGALADGGHDAAASGQVAEAPQPGGLVAKRMAEVSCGSRLEARHHDYRTRFGASVRARLESQSDCVSKVDRSRADES